MGEWENKIGLYSNLIRDTVPDKRTGRSTLLVFWEFGLPTFCMIPYAYNRDPAIEYINFRVEYICAVDLAPVQSVRVGYGVLNSGSAMTSHRNEEGGNILSTPLAEFGATILCPQEQGTGGTQCTGIYATPNGSESCVEVY